MWCGTASHYTFWFNLVVVVNLDCAIDGNIIIINRPSVRFDAHVNVRFY